MSVYANVIASVLWLLYLWMKILRGNSVGVGRCVSLSPDTWLLFVCVLPMWRRSVFTVWDSLRHDTYLDERFLFSRRLRAQNSSPVFRYLGSVAFAVLCGFSLELFPESFDVPVGVIGFLGKSVTRLSSDKREWQLLNLWKSRFVLSKSRRWVKGTWPFLQFFWELRFIRVLFFFFFWVLVLGTWLIRVFPYWFLRCSATTTSILEFLNYFVLMHGFRCFPFNFTESQVGVSELTRWRERLASFGLGKCVGFIFSRNNRGWA